MNRSQSKNQSAYQKTNNDLRKRIMESTMMRSATKKQDIIINKRQIKSSYLPQIHQSIKSQITDRNIKFKAQQLQEKLDQILVQARNTRQQYRELIQLISFMKQNLIYEELYAIKADLDGQISGFSRFIRSIKHSNGERYRQVQDNCNDIWDKNEQLRQCIFKLTMRVEKIQQKMGFSQHL